MPAKEKSEWLKGCDVCNVGLIKVMDDMIAKNGITVNKAAKLLAEEGDRQVGMQLYSPNALRQRYLLHKGQREPNPKKVVHNEQPQEVDIRGCTICGKEYDATKRKYPHSCPYCSGDADHSAHNTGWKEEPINQQTVQEEPVRGKPRSSEMSLEFIKDRGKASASAKERTASELEKAARHIEKVADLLEMIVDGALKDDGTKYDKLASESIRNHGPRIVYCYYRLGISQESTVNFFEGEKGNGKELIIKGNP